MSKRGTFGKLLFSDTSSACEYFTPFSKNQPITAAVFAPNEVI